MPEITKTETVFTTPWFELLARTVAGGDPAQPHYAVREKDYVCAVAITAENEIVLVRQFRAAVEQAPWELPAGHVEAGEDPAGAAARELLEETGFRPEKMELLGCLLPDTGRLANRLWCYFAAGTVKRASTWSPEAGIEVACLPLAEFWNRVRSLKFKPALHLSAVFLAVMRGLMELPAR